MSQDEPDKELAVERYLRKEMDSPDMDEFEQNLLWDKAVQDDFVVAQRLREGMSSVAGSAARHPTAGWSAWFRSPRYAIAASVLLAVTAFGWLSTWLTLEAELGAASDRAASARVFSIESMRGLPDADTLVQVRPGATDEPITLLVYPDLESYRSFNIELANLQGDQWVALWEGTLADVADGDTVAITLPSDLFVPGTYRIAVFGREMSAPGGLVSEDFFRVPTE